MEIIETVDINLRITGLDKEKNRILNAIAARRGAFKYEIVREALEEYAERHKDDK